MHAWLILLCIDSRRAMCIELLPVDKPGSCCSSRGAVHETSQLFTGPWKNKNGAQLHCRDLIELNGPLVILQGVVLGRHASSCQPSLSVQVGQAQRTCPSLHSCLALLPPAD